MIHIELKKLFLDEVSECFQKEIQKYWTSDIGTLSYLMLD